MVTPLHFSSAGQVYLLKMQKKKVLKPKGRKYTFTGEGGSMAEANAVKRKMRKGRKRRGFEFGAAPSGKCKESSDLVTRVGSEEGGEKEERKEGEACQKAGLPQSVLASGFVSQFTSLLVVASSQMRGQEGGGEGGTSRQLCFSFCFFTKKTKLGLKLKQHRTRKRSTASCSPSFSQFPVQGGHFVTWAGEEHTKVCHCFCFFHSRGRGVSQSTLDFFLCKTTSLDRRGEGGKRAEKTNEQEGSFLPQLVFLS